MTTGLAEEIGAGLGQNIQPTSQYYRQPDGWITFDTNTSLEKLAYIKAGWEPLDQYPAFDASPYVAAHNFEHLFMFGGAHEMPVDQVIATGLYMNPPLVPTCRQALTQFHRGHSRVCWVGAQPVKFPQLEGMDLTPFPCGFCDRILPTEKAKTQHQSVAHKEELGNLQMGNSLAGALGNIGQLGRDLDADSDLIKRLYALEQLTVSQTQQIDTLSESLIDARGRLVSWEAEQSAKK